MERIRRFKADRLSEDLLCLRMCLAVGKYCVCGGGGCSTEGETSQLFLLYFMR